MVERSEPDAGVENPAVVRAMYRAMEQAAIPSDSLVDRMAALGNVYHIGTTYTVTPTQGSSYLFIDNRNVGDPFQIRADEIKVSGGNAKVYVRDEPTLDETTFTQQEFKNIRSDVTPGPDTEAYFGYDSNVTISDKGRVYDEDFIKASAGSPGATSTGAGSDGNVRYIIGDDSSAMLEVQNDSSNEIEVSVSTFFMYLPDVPSILADENHNL